MEWLELKSGIKDWNKKFICCISRPNILPSKKQKENHRMGKDTVHTTCRTWDQNQGKGLVLKHTLEDSLRPGLNLDRSSYMVLSNDLWRSIPWSWLLPLKNLKPLLPRAQEQCLVSCSNIDWEDFPSWLQLWFHRAQQRAVRSDKRIKIVTQPFSDFFSISQCIYWREPCRNVRRMAGWSKFLGRASVEPSSFASLIIPGKEFGCKMMFRSFAQLR